MLGSFGLIAYILIGYPLLVTVLARLVGRQRANPDRPPETWPTVTVLVAAYNEESVIARRIQNLLATDYPLEKLTILVVADGSDDRTVEIVRSFSDSRVTVSEHGPRLGKSAALSRVIPSIRSDIVVFSDANNEYESGGLTRLIAPFSDPNVGAVTGSKRVRPDAGQVGVGEGVYWRYESVIKASESRIGSCVAVTGEMLAVRTNLLTELPPSIIKDDFYLAMGVLRAGADVVYEPEAVSWEPASLSVADDRLRRERIVAGRVQALLQAREIVPWARPLAAWQVISHKLLRPIIPALAGVGLVSSVMAVRGSARSGRGSALPLAVLGGQVVLYGAAHVGRTSQDPGRIPKLAAYLVDSHRSSLVGSISYLRGQRSATWAKAERIVEPDSVQPPPSE
jgi:cellulose synthase/poly-beta-1,6-N-acetylglucosamine synthase-like glycosyltransferase